MKSDINYIAMKPYIVGCLVEGYETVGFRANIIWARSEAEAEGTFLKELSTLEPILKCFAPMSKEISEETIAAIVEYNDRN